MKRFNLQLIFICCSALIFFSLIHQGTALKCRTKDHRQTNDQFQRVMNRCKDRILQEDDENSSNDDSDDHSLYDENNDDDDDEESSESDEKKFHKKLTNNRNGTYANNGMMQNSGSKNNGDRQMINSRRYEQSSTSRPYPYHRIDMQNNNATSGRTRFTNDRLPMRNDNNTASKNGGPMNNVPKSGHNNMQTKQHDQACVVQCFFDELNLIDENGFPEKSAVTKIMMQNIQEQELQDFVEEAVLDCFYMINEDKNKEQCKFSQNLLNCLASKGRERCEDWESQ